VREFHRKVLAALPPGFAIETVGRKHPVICRPDGTPLRDTLGRPIVLGCTPSDWHALKNALAQIRRALEGREG
jgi:hypothetical protein